MLLNKGVVSREIQWRGFFTRSMQMGQDTAGAL